MVLMIWFVMKVQPFGSLKENISMALDELTILVFLGFSLYFHFKKDINPKKAKGIAYALISVIVLSISKNLLAIWISSIRDLREK